jgi:hypothetical protein
MDIHATFVGNALIHISIPDWRKNEWLKRKKNDRRMNEEGNQVF